MAYNPTTWVDRLVDKPNRFRITDNGDGTVSITPEPGTITAGGTPFNAANMNHIEQGIVGSVQKTGDTMTGALGINTGSSALRLQPGSLDHVYMEFYARSGSPNTRSGFFGYPDAANPNIMLANEIAGGNINLSTNGGVVNVQGWKVWTEGNDGAGSGLDADLLDGKHASDFAPSGYGLGGAARGVSGTNFNDHVASGFYYGSNMLNSPNGSADWFFFYAIQHGGIDYCVQVATHYWSNRQWFRRKQADVWQPWIEIWNHDNLRWNSGGYLEYNNGGTWTPLGGVKHVQRGEANVATETIVNVGISPVNMNKAVVNFPNTGGTTSSSYPNGYAKLIDSTTLQIRAAMFGVYQYEIIEYY
ncbi:pyocin knob domain-containing protein [Paenibacillus ehimensis]|uniref:pyocin knob domain-containing protein n=1 Tax=Paenibacillus ehimensis TaxID=79264 RepID=UPI002DB575C4|nr:pyocin knob domain-containing protein [Paenibacillus ehimensis]MEC0211830.1 pyocin knob domain-containing protein [Paenibacillus ehimensis]